MWTTEYESKGTHFGARRLWTTEYESKGTHFGARRLRASWGYKLNRFHKIPSSIIGKLSCKLIQSSTNEFLQTLENAKEISLELEDIRRLGHH